MPDPTKDTTGAAALVDLRAMLRAKVTRPAESVTVPLDQAAAKEVRELERQLQELASQPAPIDKGAKSPAVAIAKKIEAARKRMADSEVTFTFRALDAPQVKAVHEAMDGDLSDFDEFNLRVTAAMCVEPAGMTFEILKELRDGSGEGDGKIEGIGQALFEQTIDAAAGRASGGDLTVPFSLSASSILNTKA